MKKNYLHDRRCIKANPKWEYEDDEIYSFGVIIEESFPKSIIESKLKMSERVSRKKCVSLNEQARLEQEACQLSHIMVQQVCGLKLPAQKVIIRVAR